MKVKELIALLQEANQEQEVAIGGAKHKTPGKQIGGVWHGSGYVEIFPA